MSCLKKVCFFHWHLDSILTSKRINLHLSNQGDEEDRSPSYISSYEHVHFPAFTAKSPLYVESRLPPCYWFYFNSNTKYHRSVQAWLFFRILTQGFCTSTFSFSPQCCMYPGKVKKSPAFMSGYITGWTISEECYQCQIVRAV